MPFNWSPGIGDPTFTGWFTVAAYFVSSWLCLRAFMAAKAGPPRPYGETILALARVLSKHWPNPPKPAIRASLWLAFGVMLALLGLNKQLDLQTLFTELARYLAWNLGVYEHRRIAQVLFILVLGIVMLWGLRLLVRFVGELRSELLLPLSGFAFLLGFVLIRAASFHHIDALIGFSVAGISFNALLELPGIILIGYSAAQTVRARSDS